MPRPDLDDPVLRAYLAVYKSLLGLDLAKFNQNSESTKLDCVFASLHQSGA